MFRAKHRLALACLSAFAVALWGRGWHPLVTARADGAVAGSGLYGLSPIDDLLRVAEKEDAERAKAGVMVVVGGALLLFAIIYFAVKAAQTKPKSFPPQPRQTKGTAALIEELMTLRDKGVLTEAEFQGKKAEILSRM